MLDHVERGRIAEQPAGKHLAPGKRCTGAGAFLYVHLHEGTGFGRAFPRQGLLASGKPQDDIANAACLTALQPDFLRQVVAFVEQAQRCHAVLDRGSELAFHCRGSSIGRADRSGNGPVLFLRRRLASAAGSKRHQRRQRHGKPRHPQPRSRAGATHGQAFWASPSGDQAS